MRRDEEEYRRRGPFPPMDRERLVSAAARIAAIHSEIRAVYLFGSHARGNVRPSSDIDLALLVRPVPVDTLPLEVEVADFVEREFETPADVIVLRRDLPAPLLFEIFSVQTILFARDPDEAHLEACRGRAAYRDIQPRLDRQYKRISKHIRELNNALNPT